METKSNDQQNPWQGAVPKAYLGQTKLYPFPVEIVSRLERPNHPPNGICSCDGVNKSVHNLYISITERKGSLQVILEQSLFYRPASVHSARVEAVAAALTCGVSTTWTGEDGHDGVGMLLTRAAPKSLITAIANYGAIGFRCFDPTPMDKAGYRVFKEWFNA